MGDPLTKRPTLLASRESSEAPAATYTQFQAALDRLQSLGIVIRKGSRLDQYRLILAASATSLNVGVLATPGAAVLSEAHALGEATEIVAIVSQLTNTPDREQRQRLVRLQKGMDDPDAEVQAAGRDAQFELWLSAQLSGQGMEVVLGTPDLRVNTPSGPVWIEAKRLGSASAFDDRLHAAVRVLRDCSGPGIVAIGVDQAIRPKRQILKPSGMAEARSQLSMVLHQFVERHYKQIRARTANENVDAVLTSGRMPVLIPGSSQLGVYHGFQFTDVRRPLRPATQWLVDQLSRSRAP